MKSSVLDKRNNLINRDSTKNESRIITRTPARWQTSDWQNALKNMSRSLQEVLDYCEIGAEDLNLQQQAEADFCVKAPKHYLNQIEKGNAQDPLLLQILPTSSEVNTHTQAEKDPLKEERFNKAPGLIHKYAGRVLLIANPSCAIHCRYCFRRHFDYQENTLSREDWQKTLDYIRNDESIFEVILSGGDPLSNNDKQLGYLLKQISETPHINTIRFHTRIPTVLPERITDDLLELLQSIPQQMVMVLHINHANEISDDVASSLHKLAAAGIRLLNQSVLLKGVNDHVEALQSLMLKLHQLNVGAYYLHTLDTVEGAMHFAVDDDLALGLYCSLQAKLPGYMLPKLVREIPFESNKTLLLSSS